MPRAAGVRLRPFHDVTTEVSRETGAIRLAERLVAVLDRGSFTSTYKYAVLLALLDLCLENTESSGAPPSMITTRQLAEKVLALYWRQLEPYATTGAVLVQMGGRKEQASAILHAVDALRTIAVNDVGTASLSKVKLMARDSYEQHVDDVEWTLIEMPLPRLQTIGREHVPFLYELGWTKGVSRSVVRRYQRGDDAGFDNRIQLFTNVGEHLIQLNTLLRMLIQRAWAKGVSRLNNIDDDPLEDFLFGVDRSTLVRVREPLLDLQNGRCFYCEKSVDDGAHVDHFIPWSRHASNALDNLVVAHAKCNLQKSDHLAAAQHIETWATRTHRLDDDLNAISEGVRWERAPSRTLSVARSIYFRLPDDSRLWVRGSTFEPLMNDVIRAAIA